MPSGTIEKSRPNRYEKAISQSAKGSPRLISVFSGAARSVRLSKAETDPHQQTIWETAADVIGPTFFWFIWWILETSKKQGIERLYFLARDGDILCKIAKLIAQAWGYPQECRYLYASREALYFPAIDTIGNFELDWMTSVYDDFQVSVNAICERVEISPGNISRCLYSAGFPPELWDKKLTRAELERIRKCLSEPEFLTAIKPKIDTCFKNVIGYLKQEKLFADDKFAVIDIGWNGGLQYALSKILEKNNCRPLNGIQGYYFGLSPEPRVYQNDSLDSFFIGKQRREFRNDILCEIFAASESPKTKSYYCRDSEFLPVFDNTFPGTRSWGIATQQESILAFTREILELCRPENFDLKAGYAIIASILYPFFMNPSPAEAETYGKFPMTVTMIEKRINEIAPPFYIKNWRLPKTYWVSGSCVRSKFWLGTKMWETIQNHPDIIPLIRNIFLRMHR